MRKSFNQPKVDEFEDYLREVFQQLARFKRFPKYQLERRVDGFIGVFLIDILKATWDWDTKIVAPEFPIKKEGNNQSINVDYLLYRKQNASAQAAWLFVELKTDTGSFDERQYGAYKRAQIDGMVKLREGLNDIFSKTRDKNKYKILFKKLKSFNLDRRIELVYLVPSDTKMPNPTEDLRILTFKQISRKQMKRYPKAWCAFRNLVVRSIDP